MTKKELIELIEEYPDDAVITCSGDGRGFWASDVVFDEYTKEKMKSTNESVIVITDSFICTSMVDEEGKTDNENIQDHIAKVFVLIISYLTHMAKRTDLN